MNGTDPGIRLKFRTAYIGDLIVGISSIVLFGLYYGIAKSDYTAISQERFARRFPEELAIIPFSADDAESSGTVRARLAKEKRSIGPYDTLIAGQALARDLTLVTSNVREFERVEGLRWEDWSSG